MAAVAGPGGALVQWLDAEMPPLGRHGRAVGIASGTMPTPARPMRSSSSAPAHGPADTTTTSTDGAMVLDVADVRRGHRHVARHRRHRAVRPHRRPDRRRARRGAGRRAVLVTQDHIAGNELSRTGDLAPANVRLAAAWRAHRAPRRIAAVGRDPARSSWRTASAACAARRLRGRGRLRVPPAHRAAAPAPTCQAGDCVAPRTIHEAILEGRRAALAI